MNTYAILSDIHSNVWALEAVLSDIRRRGISGIINLGDTLYGPLAPQACADLLVELPLTGIQGNQDRILFDDQLPIDNPTIEFTRKDLTSDSLDWLAGQPANTVIDNRIYLCHGTPASDMEYLLETKSVQGGSLKPDREIRNALAAVPQPVILCGHSHIPRHVWLSDDRLVINPGSVGLPAYADGPPQAHKMENGSPHARYSILSDTQDGWKVEQVMLSYPWENAIRTARLNGREDWAVWLSSGRA